MKKKTDPKFIVEIKKQYDFVSRKINETIDNINNDGNYTINYQELVEEYEELGIAGIEEFCANFTFGRLLGKENDSRKNRKAMHLEVSAYLHKLQKEGKVH